MSETNQFEASCGNQMVRRYEKMSSEKTKAKPIGFFEAYLLKRKGYGDGRLGLPKSSDKGCYLSPFIREEIDTAAGFDANEWLRCEGLTAELHIEAMKLSEEIERIRNNLNSTAASASQVPDEDRLRQRFKGESSLDEAIIHQRRMKEYTVKKAAVYAECGKLESEFNVASARLTELVGKIYEYENIAKLRCECARDRACARLSAYWQGLFKTHPNASELPPIPPDSPFRLSGEEAYAQRHAFTRTLISNKMAQQEVG